MVGKQISSYSSRKSIASPPPPYSSPSVVIDDGVNNSFSGIDGVVAVMLVIRRIDGVVMLVDVVKKGKRFVCQPFPLCGSVRILITRL